MITLPRSRAFLAAPLVAVALLAGGCGATNSSQESAPNAVQLSDSTDNGSTDDENADNENAVAIDVLEGDDVDKPAPIDGGSSTPEPSDIDVDPGQPRYSVVAQATAASLTARTEPEADAPAIADFANPTATGSPLVFRAVPGGASSADWIEVQLPVLPNGTTGWIERDLVELSDNPYRVEISRADYSLRVYHLNELWVEAPIAVGNGETPTPVGDFYLLELLQPTDPGGAYGPYAFGLSGFSEVLTSFGGADEAIIGLHGTNDPASLGTDVSHGCIRLENDIIEQFAAVLPLGTPVSIT